MSSPNKIIVKGNKPQTVADLLELFRLAKYAELSSVGSTGSGKPVKIKSFGPHNAAILSVESNGMLFKLNSLDVKRSEMYEGSPGIVVFPSHSVQLEFFNGSPLDIAETKFKKVELYEVDLRGKHATAWLTLMNTDGLLCDLAYIDDRQVPRTIRNVAIEQVPDGVLYITTTTEYPSDVRRVLRFPIAEQQKVIMSEDSFSFPSGATLTFYKRAPAGLSSSCWKA